MIRNRKLDSALQGFRMPHGNYKTSDAARAAGVAAKKINNDIDRNVIRLPGPEPGKGHHRRFSLASIYEIAIGHMLTKLKVPPTDAMKLAGKFLEPQRGREAAKPFKSGKTLLIADTSGTGSIINLEADQDITAFLDEAALIVDIGRIISNVNMRLL
jgi:hypothetical protein